MPLRERLKRTWQWLRCHAFNTHTPGEVQRIITVETSTCVHCDLPIVRFTFPTYHKTWGRQRYLNER